MTNFIKIVLLFVPVITVIFLNVVLGQNQADQSSKALGQMTLHVIPQSHIDLAWWWRYDPHTVHVVARHTLETAFANMEKFPEYTFTYLQVPSIEPMEQLYPELFYKIRYYLHNKTAQGEYIPNPGASGTGGRLAIGSGLYCEVDGSLPCGESLVRQCLYGKRYYQHQFGIEVKTAWFQDAWTHPWTLPQILKKSGIDSYMYTRPRPEDKPILVPDSLKDEYLAAFSKEQNDRMFWWEAPDGSRVFAYKPLAIGGKNLPSDDAINNYLINLNRQYGVMDGITLIGPGNHGGGALRADIERMQQIMAARQTGTAANIPAGLKFSTPMQFVAAVMQKPHQLPVIRDELIPTIRGAYTTVGEIKKGNRYSENLLLTLEKFAAIASILGLHPYPHEWLHQAWEKVMLNQFHDTISGTDINPSIADALHRYQQIATEGGIELQQALKAISRRIQTIGTGIPIVVFNPLSWERTDLVQVEFEFAEKIIGLQIEDGAKKKVPVQIMEQTEKDGRYRVTALFIASKVPSLGYSCYWARPGKASMKDSAILSASLTQLENEFFRIQIDSVTGGIASIYDKEHQREVLAGSGPGNMIQIIEDPGDSEGFLMSPGGVVEYNLWTGKTWNVDQVGATRLIESGPVRATVQIKTKFQLARFIQRIHLYPAIRRIDFDLIIDWHGSNKMVKVAFPFSVQNDSATYEIPYGTITRLSAGMEHVAQKWVDISEAAYGVSLLNDSRYGHDVTRNTIRLSVLRSPDHPVAATDEVGMHQVRYALYPHPGDWRAANTMRRGYEFNEPLIASTETLHPGNLPAKHSFMEIEPENVIISVLKKAEDSEDLVLRFFETGGESSIAKIKLSDDVKVDAVHQTDLLEHSLEEIPSDGRLFEVKVGRCAIDSYRLITDIY